MIMPILSKSLFLTWFAIINLIPFAYSAKNPKTTIEYDADRRSINDSEYLQDSTDQEVTITTIPYPGNQDPTLTTIPNTGDDTTQVVTANDTISNVTETTKFIDTPYTSGYSRTRVAAILLGIPIITAATLTSLIHLCDYLRGKRRDKLAQADTTTTKIDGTGRLPSGPIKSRIDFQSSEQNSTPTKKAGTGHLTTTNTTKKTNNQPGSLRSTYVV